MRAPKQSRPATAAAPASEPMFAKKELDKSAWGKVARNQKGSPGLGMGVGAQKKGKKLLQGSFGGVRNGNASLLSEAGSDQGRRGGADTAATGETPATTMAVAIAMTSTASQSREERGDTTRNTTTMSTQEDHTRRLWDRRLWERSKREARPRQSHAHSPLLVLTKPRSESNGKVDTSGLILVSKSLPRLKVPPPTSWSPPSKLTVAEARWVHWCAVFCAVYPAPLSLTGFMTRIFPLCLVDVQLSRFDPPLPLSLSLSLSSLSSHRLGPTALASKLGAPHHPQQVARSYEDHPPHGRHLRRRTVGTCRSSKTQREHPQAQGGTRDFSPQRRRSARGAPRVDVRGGRVTEQVSRRRRRRRRRRGRGRGQRPRRRGKADCARSRASRLGAGRVDERCWKILKLLATQGISCQVRSSACSSLCELFLIGLQYLLLYRGLCFQIR